MIISLYPSNKFRTESPNDWYTDYNVDIDMYFPLGSSNHWSVASEEDLSEFCKYFNGNDRIIDREKLIFDITDETYSLILLVFKG